MRSVRRNVRLFVGIPAPADANFASVSAALGAAGGNLVAAGSHHVTLRFFGDVEAHEVPSIVDALGDACRHRPAMAAVVEGLGAFPTTKHARVAWAGVRAAGLDALAQAVAQRTASFGEPVDTRHFVGHVTLARFKRRTDLRSLADAHRATLFGQGVLDRVVLFASTLTPQGPQHVARHVVRLAAGGHP